MGWRFVSFKNYSVRGVNRDDCSDFILNIHYAGRWPSISYSFGLYLLGEMVGCVTYGTPPSAPLKKGLAGESRIREVIELNRLVLKRNLKNEASFLISRSIKMLPKGKIIVSYADTSQGHTGVVYRASNFRYYGLSAKRTDWKVRGKEHLHGQTIADEFRGVKSRVSAMREKYGEDFYLAPRPRKHRYLYLHGDKTYKKKAANEIRWQEMPWAEHA